MIKVCVCCNKEFKTSNSKRKYCCVGCYRKSSFKNMEGLHFNNLTVLDEYKTVGKRIYWKCKCSCGKECWTRMDLLKNKVSCGCKTKEKLLEKITKHGKHRTRLYTIYKNMIKRCYCPTFKRFKNYGLRGIKVCDEWIKNKKSFFEWAVSNGYRDDLTIDRVDVNGNYCPENCRWITNAEQQKNTTRNHRVTYNGETHCIAEWARITGIPEYRIHSRLKSGWDVNDVFNLPVQEKYVRKTKNVNQIIQFDGFCG